MRGISIFFFLSWRTPDSFHHPWSEFETESAGNRGLEAVVPLPLGFRVKNGKDFYFLFFPLCLHLFARESVCFGKSLCFPRSSLTSVPSSLVTPPLLVTGLWGCEGIRSRFFSLFLCWIFGWWFVSVVNGEILLREGTVSSLNPSSKRVCVCNIYICAWMNLKLRMFFLVENALTISQIYTCIYLRDPEGVRMVFLVENALRRFERKPTETSTLFFLSRTTCAGSVRDSNMSGWLVGFYSLAFW